MNHKTNEKSKWKQMKNHKDAPGASPTSTDASSPRSAALSHGRLLSHKYNKNTNTISLHPHKYNTTNTKKQYHSFPTNTIEIQYHFTFTNRISLLPHNYTTAKTEKYRGKGFSFTNTNTTRQKYGGTIVKRASARTIFDSGKCGNHSGLLTNLSQIWENKFFWWSRCCGGDTKEMPEGRWNKNDLNFKQFLDQDLNDPGNLWMRWTL